MFKKIIGSAFLATAMTSAYAYCPAPYVGAGIGVLVNTTSNFDYGTGSIAGTPVNLSSPSHYRGVPFNLFAGYGGMYNQHFYVAGEVLVTAATADISDSVHSIKTSYGYGASILPGLMLSDHTMGFIRLGVIRTRFSNQGSTKTGGEAGIGLQTTVTQNIDVRCEYDFRGYGSFGVRFGDVNAPQTDAFNLGVIYRFD